ncbi:MAG: ABC transporter ATP-binding protein [Planctomycetota bacterium]|nr:MAG: ABC transporter ATP-binding protein [Planctomycetota bacterium]
MSASGPATESGTLLQIEDVGKTFQMGEVAVEVLRDISFDVRRGELLVMVGPSGSGKTTLLNIMGGLDTPTVGDIWYGEQNLAVASPRELTRYRREHVGFVFQFYNLVPNLTARENVFVATEISKKPLDVDETLEMVGLGERMDHFPSQLSGGEQQRVAIARALAKNPQLLLCDEPTGALDYETGKNMLRLLVDLSNTLGKTILIITHNTAIAPVANRVIRLRSGEIHEVHDNPHPQPPEEITW